MERENWQPGGRRGELTGRQRFEQGWRISVYTMIGNIILGIIKLAIGIFSGSTAMIADSVHTMSDIVSTLGVMASMAIAKKPADSNHPYGHEKAETVMAKILAIILIVIGVITALPSYRVIAEQSYNTPASAALYAAILSIVVKEAMYRITLRVGRRINSTALEADAWHHRSDAISSVAALIGIIGARLGVPVLDPIAAMVVSGLIVWVGVGIYIKSINQLMDISARPEDLDKIRAIVAGVKGVEGINKIKSRVHGPYYYVDIEVCVRPDITVYQGHEIAHGIKDRVEAEMERVKYVMVHVNPWDGPNVDGG
ncbi:MAG TPA: cation transporter [Clostridiales bacterium]|nr:cation transporter [Clostridiales bacterium]